MKALPIRRRGPVPVRAWLGLYATLIIAAAMLSAPARAAPLVTLREIATSLASPIEFVSARDGTGRMFVVEQAGVIRIFHNGVVLATPFLNLTGAGLISTGGERGLLGLAFHPQYAANGAFYIFYTRAGDGALVIARYLRDAANANIAAPASGVPILTIPHPGQANHNGGHLAFGPDGYLYIGTGDGGGGGDPFHAGQNRADLRGKLLRLEVDGGTGYTIPAGNPYAGSTCAAAGCPEIWAYGLRNPWKFSFDRTTGDLFIGDVGQGAIEEVDFQPAAAPGGTNYGWGVYEGNNCFNDAYFGVAGACAAQSNHTRPILTYNHDSNGGFSITGGYRYRGARSPLMRGYYVYADFSSRRIWAARPNALGTWATEVLLPPPAGVASISSFGEDENGELYLLDYGNGKIWAIDGPVLALTSVVSRKIHGSAGEFALELNAEWPASGAMAVEPRSNAAPHLIAFTFNASITSISTVTCTDAAGAPLGTAVMEFTASEVRVTLTGIADAQRATISLNNLNGLGANASVSLGFMLGDVNATQAVTASDISAVKARANVLLDTANFRFDVNASGAIDETDVSAVKARSGRRIP